MQVILNEQGFVDAYALVGKFGSGSVTVDEPEDIVDFEQNCHSYYLEDDKLVKSEQKQQAINTALELSDLRREREKVCFPVVNRGTLWYDGLTAEQKTELGVWYQAWLDVTDTRVSPDIPTWLN